MSVNPDHERVPAPGRFIDVAGHRLHVIDQGSGTPVLLMAALGSNWFDLDPLAARLVARSYRVIRYDRPGYGLSDDPRRDVPPTLAGETDRMLAVLDELGVDEPVIVAGHSLASLYAEGFARRWPDRTAAVAILDGSYVVLPWRVMPTSFRVGNAHRTIGLMRFAGRHTGFRLPGRVALWRWILPTPPEGLDTTQRSWVNQVFGGTSMLLATLTENAAFPALNAALRDWRSHRPMPEVPILVVVAMSGPVVWQHYWHLKQRWYAAMLGGRVHTLQARHFLVLEQPDEVADVIVSLGASQ